MARFSSSLLISFAAGAISASADSLADLRSKFERPPDDARIMMRWWWFGPGVTKPELAREMRTMKEGGIGGFEVQPVYPLALDDPELGFKNVPYLSDDYLNTLAFAARTARELGLRMDVTLGSGWPFGGPHTPVTEAAGRLRCDYVAVAPGESSAPMPDITSGEKRLAVFLAEGDRKQFSPTNLRRLDDIERGRLRLPPGLTGPHVLLFFIASRTGQMVKRAAVGAEGFVLDHYDRSAIDHHLQSVGDRLMKALKGNPPYAVFSDSLEVFASDWTGDMLAQFLARRGYDLTPYLPALVGDIGEKTGAVRYDWGKTLTELADERYLAPLQEWARKNGTRFRSQTYGTPPVTLSSNALVDLPEGEGPHWRSFSASRWAASASHLYGKPVTSSETWTWLHSPAFRATPLDMKAEADLHFLQGINQLVGHGWPYSPEIAGEPGWRFYAAAVFNNHNPWWLVMPDITRYLQRVSFLLRQGKPANDVALYLPTADARARFTAGKDSIDRSMDGLIGPNVIPQILDAGYNVDFIDDQAIERVGVQHPVLILPGVERMPLATYRKIQEYAGKGGIVIATRRTPSLAPGLVEAEKETPQIQELSRTLFEVPGGHFVRDEQSLGKELSAVFKPDIVTEPKAVALGFIHRKLDSGDIYFVANTSNKHVRTQITFRVSGLEAELWDPFTGVVSSLDDALELEPYESRVVVFSSQHHQRGGKQRRTGALDLSSDWSVSFPELKRTKVMRQLHSWSDDDDTKFYSGQGVYTKIFTAPESLVKAGVEILLNFGEGTPAPSIDQGKPGMRAWLESPVHEAALVYVNDQLAGSVWRPPFEVGITKLLRKGQNSIRVVVGNLAINQLAGQTMPDYRLLNLRYGVRFEPQDMNNLKPLPAGLLGPIRLITQE
jgi:hypothetical protein